MTKASPTLCALASVLYLAMFSGGCAFDIVSVKQRPTAFSQMGEPGPLMVLQYEATVGIGTGFTTTLKRGTTWRIVGRIPAGDVYETRDQVVTVEASNIHEARPVINNGAVVGFYLPVERTFVRASEAVPVTFQISH
ncbi:hypothetical protein GALL_42600 [mine drainage metagenome]|uniref:Uncharacterized protein n=1 Tax=mine drainage metagenome TaxID=410659 RepID=A0A1J5TFK5_9ZZZZ